jgi:nitric oxide reductase NorQ protein
MTNTTNNSAQKPPGNTMLIQPKAQRGFVQTDEVKELLGRALNYVKVGYPIHFRGPTGVGKTTLALHIASKLKQPVVLIHGDDQFTTKDLTGTEQGYNKKKMVDEFVRGVSKTEESMRKSWSEHRLTVAIREGYTLLYDEFTRSRPEANNILLSVLQEGILDFPIDKGDGQNYLKVHPNFRAIFTSNPEEYAGVHKTQDALLDRMVTLDLDHYDFATEIQITATKANTPTIEAKKIVNIAEGLRTFSTSGNFPTIRACIMVAKSIKKYKGATIHKDSPIFRQICHDVFTAEIARNDDREKRNLINTALDKLIDEFCGTEGETRHHQKIKIKQNQTIKKAINQIPKPESKKAKKTKPKKTVANSKPNQRTRKGGNGIAKRATNTPTEKGFANKLKGVWKGLLNN